MPFRAFVGEVVFWMNIIFDVKNKTVFENSLVFIIFYILFLRKIGILLVHKLFSLFSRPATESATTEESTEVKTEKLSLKATPLPTGLVKSKTTESTTDAVYNNWFKMPYNPDTTVKSSAKSS